MRLGTLSESGQCVIGMWDPALGTCVQDGYGVDTRISYGGEVCLDNNGQYTADLSKCAPVGHPVYAVQGIPCLAGQGPLAPGQVYCATGCKPGEVWDPVMGLCKYVGGNEWIPGLSNNVLLTGAALIAVLLMTERRR